MGMNLRTIYKRRQCGKTYDCIKRSAETGIPMVVRTVDEGRHAESCAKKMGYTKFPKPISIRNILAGKAARPDCNKVIIDDADVIMNVIMQHIFGCDVDTLALVERNEKGHEIDKFGDDINEKYNLGD